jgi:hypothetical protein
MECTIPRPLQVEHEKLHAELVKATTMESKVGEAARTVAALLHPHFVKEEEYALPPLGLLPLLATGQVAPEMRDVLSMIDRVRTELPQMLNEHKTIMAALHQLVAAAKSENQTEEEVFYPTAILIKEYLKLKLDM